LSDEELAIFDLLTKPQMSLSKKETEQVKKVARELLATLKQEKLGNRLAGKATGEGCRAAHNSRFIGYIAGIVRETYIRPKM